MKRFLLLVILTALAFATSSCQKPSQNRSHKARNYTIEKGDDRTISEQIKCTLKNYYNLSMKARTTTKVITDNGRVTIKGRVVSDNERKIVISLVKQIPGVNCVNDQLEVICDEK